MYHKLLDRPDISPYNDGKMIAGGISYENKRDDGSFFVSGTVLVYDDGLYTKRTEERGSFRGKRKQSGIRSY